MMPKTILLTGATDGIGLETAKILVKLGHKLLLHGRNPGKLNDVASSLARLNDQADIDQFAADLSILTDVESMAAAIAQKYQALDVLINNAGVFKAPQTTTPQGLDIRFVVNTLAPYLLTQRLMPMLGPTGRIINLSSAAQAPVDLQAMAGKTTLADMDAYAQSKLAITMWSRRMAQSLNGGPTIIAVNPGSLLASKMVRDGFGVPGKDIRIGANILVRAALDDEFTSRSGEYFDNDAGKFASPHADALDDAKSSAVVHEIERILQRFG